MRYFILLLILFLSLFARSEDLHGTWKGVMTIAGQTIEEGTLLYADFSINEGTVTGQMREEIFETEMFAVKDLRGTSSDNIIAFEQRVVSKSTRSSKVKWCRMKGELKYDEKTGYLTGDFQSIDCRRVIGKIILFKADFTLSKDETLDVSHIWFPQFINDYELGLSAPKIRDLERKNFRFEPIYFDYDKSDVRPEYFPFLDRLILVVRGHSDLRVKVVGHTDADGSFAYNDKLSKERAEAIIQYFVAKGLERDRLEFEFKGERMPVDSNDTPEGKQRNRRVDFSFI
jgi:OOP family OmpA-OmpF porin